MVLSAEQADDEELEDETPLSSNVAFFSQERRAKREALRQKAFGR